MTRRRDTRQIDLFEALPKARRFPAIEKVQACFRLTPDGRIEHVAGTASSGQAGPNPARRMWFFDGTSLTEAQLAFALAFGRWPKPGMQVDHIDRDPANHRPENLREASRRLNATNRRMVETAKHIRRARDRWHIQVWPYTNTKRVLFCDAWKLRRDALARRAADLAAGKV